MCLGNSWCLVSIVSVGLFSVKLFFSGVMVMVRCRFGWVRNVGRLVIIGGLSLVVCSIFSSVLW